VSLLIGLFIVFFHQYIVTIFRLEEISSYLYLIPFVVFSAGVLQIIEQWMIRTRQFSVSSKATLVQSLIVNGNKAGIGYFYPTSSVLISLSALNHGLKAIFLIIFAKDRIQISKLYKGTDKKSLKPIAKKYNDFPLFRAPQTVVNSISVNIPILMLVSFFGPVSVGFYSICRTVLSMPTRLLAKSVGDVFYPKISTIASEGENVTNTIKKATYGLTVIGIVPYGVIVFFGPSLFEFVFGSDWRIAGEYARWIS